MKLTFLGTRGEIDARSDRHRRHTALLIEYRGGRVMIDCGDDWRGHLDEVHPHAIVLTHAHPDHAWGLNQGAPCGVWATTETWENIDDYPIEERHTVAPERRFHVDGIAFEAYAVEHSTRCPAVGYRISAGRPTVWYAPDLVYIERRERALEGVRLYIGDGATLATPFVRKRGERLIGHTPVRTQLTWCEKAGVPEAIITHCGSRIVEGDERSIAPRVRRWAQQRGVSVRIAFDGMEKVLR
jgi:phosphoribosyl 1,2-cyclic phosphodiesterase